MDIKELLLEAAEFCKARDGLLLSVRLTAAAEKCGEPVGIVYNVGDAMRGGHGRVFSWLVNPSDIPEDTFLYLAPQPAQPDSPPTLQLETIAMLNKILPGRPVSVDVSTGDADFGNRIFATIAEVQDDAQGGLIVLATDAVANYAAPQPAQVPEEKPLPELMMATYHEAIGWNDCRKAMLAAAQQPDSRDAEDAISKQLAMYAAAFNAARQFIESHVSDSDQTQEMRGNYTLYRQWCAAIDAAMKGE